MGTLREGLPALVLWLESQQSLDRIKRVAAHIRYLRVTSHTDGYSYVSPQLNQNSR
jgi:hypothetical protein